MEHLIDGEWVQTKNKGWVLGCCDCGLVHTINFKIIKSKNGKKKYIFMQFFRDKELTNKERRQTKQVKR